MEKYNIFGILQYTTFPKKTITGNYVFYMPRMVWGQSSPKGMAPHIVKHGNAFFKLHNALTLYMYYYNQVLYSHCFCQETKKNLSYLWNLLYLDLVCET